LQLEKNSQVKGKLLEEFLILLFWSIEWVNIVAKNLNNWDEELDIVLQNNIHEWFFANLNSPLMIIEAKNWSSSVPTKVTRDFAMKAHLHNNLSRVWILVAVNWVTWEVDDLLKRLGSTNELLVIITGDDIQKLLNQNKDPKKWFMDLFSNSLK
jgi:hypothetical protein